VSAADRSLPAIVEGHAEAAGGAPAITCAGSTLTYAGLAERSAAAAGRLAALGVGPGDRVVVALGNTLELPLLLLAAARLGAILVPLNLQHRGDVLRHMVANVSPRLVITDGGAIDEEQAAVLRGAAPLARQVGIGPDPREPLAAVADGDPVTATGDPLDPVAIVYTSGTSGRSKGAILSQAFVAMEAEAYLEVVEPRPDDVFWSVLPLFHTNAMCLTLAGALLAGGHAVLRPRFSASRFWSDLRADGGTATNLLGAMVPILLKGDPAAAAGHRLRVVTGGGVPVASVREFSARFGVPFRELFGLTETGVNAGETGTAGRRGSVGRPLPNWEVRVDSGPGEEGEIQIRGRRPGAIFSGYFNDPERTAESFTGDGFFRTGDRGRFDGDGYLYFRGRIKESIRRRGENVSPWEVEEAFARHPAVAECAAVAVPAELGEDEVKIAYVLRPEADASPGELYRFCRGEMAPFMVPRFYQRLDALPKTATEKVERARLVAPTGATVEVDPDAGPAAEPQSQLRGGSR
jgi:carnitine-CoA ligase